MMRTTVGRKPRRAEGETNSQRAARAGFEPRRADGYTDESAVGPAHLT
jgi:hypothetical protein